MAVVIDTSVMAAQLLQDEEHSHLAQTIMEQLDDEDMIVPRIFWYEIYHVLLKVKRAKRITQADYNTCLLQLQEEFSPSTDNEHDVKKMINLAEQHNLSVYDASYLETALRNRAGLATFDGPLAKAAAKESVKNPASQVNAISSS